MVSIGLHPSPPSHTLSLEEYSQLPDQEPMADPQCVLLNNKLYARWWAHKIRLSAQIFISPAHPVQWSPYYCTPAVLYAIATYHSQLVLVSGVEGTSMIPTCYGQVILEWTGGHRYLPCPQHAGQHQL